MQSQVRGDLLGPKSQPVGREGLGSLEEKRDRLRWEGSVRTPSPTHSLEAGECGVGGGIQGRLHSAWHTWCGLDTLLGPSGPICEKKPLGPP